MSVAACGEESARDERDAAHDAGADAAEALDGGDAPSTDSGASDARGASDAGVQGEAEQVVEAERSAPTKGPYLHVRDTLPGAPPALRWRVETQGDATLSLHVFADDGRLVFSSVSAVTLSEVDFAWPPSTAVTVDNRDEAGTYALHEWVASFDDALRGARVQWEVRGLRGGPIQGSVRVPPAPETPFRVGWVSDTMFPTSVGVAEQLAAPSCDLLIHGGDIQYQSNPLDTWNGYFAAFAAAHRGAPMHYCLGNHEYENVEEVGSMTSRLFGLWEAGYQAFTYAGWRWILLNSELDFGVDGSQQMTFLEQELENVGQMVELRGAIVAFHRPYFTLSRSRPNLAAREAVHGRLRRGPVKLVLTGHNHCYERFEVDGITYVMDGGGGAGLYDPNDHADEIEAERPGEGALRQAFERSHGVTLLAFDAQGGIAGRRVRETGEEVDRWSIQP